MRLLSHFDHRFITNGEARSGREVLVTQIQIEIQLVARERPPITRTGEEIDQPDADHIELHVRMGGAVFSAAAPAHTPGVANESVGVRQLTGIQHLTLILGGTAHDHLENTVSRWRRADRDEPGLELLSRTVDHRTRFSQVAAAYVTIAPDSSRSSPGAPVAQRPQWSRDDPSARSVASEGHTMKVLVSAASKHGSTRDIAERIAAALVDRGLVAEIVEPENVTTLDGYDAVVVGSAVYAAGWRKEASEFVDRLGAQLRDRPVWLFSSGPVGPEEEQVLELRHLDELLELSGARDHTWFAGKLDRDDLNLGERAVVKMAKAPYGDFRRWEAIDEWAGAVAVELSSG